VVDKMAKENKKNKWTNDEKWTTFLAPLLAWLASFKPKNEDDEDMVDATNLAIKRGNRNADNRPNLVKQLKIDFAEMAFDGWAVERLDKELVKSMVANAKENRAVHIAFFNGFNGVLTYTKDSVKYAFRDAEQYADRQESSDLSKSKALHKEGLDWASPTFPIEAKSDDS
tara:strand:- start:262 stop:771 length:510 start_codon:yes stop_codon:yes gene_type:complete